MLLSVPIAIDTVTEKHMDMILQTIKACKTQRVFVCCFPYIGDNPEKLKSDIAKYARFQELLKKEGLEVGVWLDSFGHGVRLTHDKTDMNLVGYTSIRGFGIIGNKGTPNCPLDEGFRRAYFDYVKEFAKTHPDIIMLDDDFRLSMRGYGVGCACKLHMASVRKEIGRPIGRKQLFRKVFMGKPGGVRDAWLKVSSESLMAFARGLRREVDLVDKSIRLGYCSCVDTWEISGVEPLELAKAFAGDSKPFMRTIGAPYWVRNMAKDSLGGVIEYTRSQFAYCKDKGVEVFSEGDVYPRPSYKVPTAYLECYDGALRADGNGDGILKYMFCYDHPFDYEPAYFKRHIRDEKPRLEVEKLFEGSTSCGVYVYNDFGKFKRADLRLDAADTSHLAPHKSPSKLKDFGLEILRRGERFFAGAYEVGDMINDFACNRAQILFSQNGIPTTYIRNPELPIALFGENARSVPECRLDSGAILDVRAAQILEERGIDVGLLGVVNTSEGSESFEAVGDTLNCFDVCARGMEVKNSANILSRYLPGGKVASYTYENPGGQRFFVLGMDLYVRKPTSADEFFVSFRRQELLVQGIEWAGRRRLPAVCYKNHGLYILTSRGKDGSLIVGLFNLSVDKIVTPEVILGEKFTKASFILCEGELKEDRVRLSTDVMPYEYVGMALNY